MKKYILLFCLLLFLSGCGSFAVMGIVRDIKAYKENSVIKNINSECLRREGVGCIVLKDVVNKIVGGKDSLFIANGYQVVRFDLNRQKAAVLAGLNGWGWFHKSRDGYGQKAEFDYLHAIALIDDKLYLQELSNPYPRLLDIASGQVTTDKTNFNKIPYSYASMVLDGSSLYFIDNKNSRIVKTDVSFAEIDYIPVFSKDKSAPPMIGMAKVGDFIYFTTYDHKSEVCEFARVNLKNGKTRLIFRQNKLKILFSNKYNVIKLIPETGDSLIIIAVEANDFLHLRIFDKNGKRILDKRESELKNKTVEIEVLKRRLAEANAEEFADDMDIELASAVKLITGFPRETESVASQQCLSPDYRPPNTWLRTRPYIANDEKNVYFNDGCLNIRRFNIQTGKLELLARKPKYANSINGMTTLGKYLYILDSFEYANKTMIRRINLNNGQTSYQAGIWEN